VERHRKPLLLLTAAWTGSGVVLYLWVPLFLPTLLLLSPVAPVAWYVATSRRLPQHKPTPITFVLVMAGAYLALNTSWSLSPETAYVSLVMYLLFVLAWYVTSNTLPQSDTDVLQAMAIGLYAGLVVAGTALFVETASHQWVRRAFMSWLPALRANPRDMVVEGDRVTVLMYYLINRNVAAMTMLFWPISLMATLLAPAGRRRYWWLAGLTPIAAGVLVSGHATSKIAFVGAAMAFVAFQYAPTATRRAIAWSWTATILLVAPLATLAYHSQLYLSPWLPHSAQHRIVIWGYTSHLIAHAPILGSGINTARAVNDADGVGVAFAPGSEFPLTTNLHSHNIYLQAWYETGAVGALMLLAIGLLVLGASSRAPKEVQPYLYASFTTCALLGGSSFSLWQPWFMGSFGFVAVLAAGGWALAERSRAQDGVSACDSARS
jgi:O-antigen ligase